MQLSYLSQNNLKASWLETPLGQMLAISDSETLYFLEFSDQKGLDRALIKLKLKTKVEIVFENSKINSLLATELIAYFKGSLKIFKTPLYLWGSSFQKLAWSALQQIPYGETRSYVAQAKSISKENSYRAVANANGANPIAIIVPCHRVININGDLGGYAGGLERKKWLINHEK
jgi:O-6-methylguanine DNA methyltransferase